MSVDVSRVVWKQSEESGNRLLMLLAIADFANDDGWAYPSVATLAERVRINRRNAQNLIDALETAGEIVIYNRTRSKENKSHLSNAYHLPKYGVADAQHPSDWLGHFTMRTHVARDITSDDAEVMSPETLGNVARDIRVMSPETSESLLNHQITKKEDRARESSLDIELKSTSESTQPQITTPSKQTLPDGSTTPTQKPPAPAPVFRLARETAVAAVYQDGEPTTRAVIEQAATDLFLAWFEGLRQVQCAPAQTQLALWGKHQQAAVNLALAKIKPEYVTKFLVDKYTDTEDQYWQRLDSPMSVHQVGEHIVGWIRRREKEQAQIRAIYTYNPPPERPPVVRPSAERRAEIAAEVRAKQRELREKMSLNGKIA